MGLADRWWTWCDDWNDDGDDDGDVEYGLRLEPYVEP
jgi:hypothetical protein